MKYSNALTLHVVTYRAARPRALPACAAALALSVVWGCHAPPSIERRNAAGAAAHARERPTCPRGMLAVRGGEFFMGDGAPGAPDQRHRARVSPFCLDQTEVTVAQFRAGRASATARPRGVAYPGGRSLSLAFDAVTTPSPWSPLSHDEGGDDRSCTWSEAPGSFERHPINCVSWYAMQAHCAARGARLPTEAEWEFAARGVELQTYPWGNEAPDARRLNVCGEECRALGWDVMAGFGRDPYVTTAPVSSFAATRPPGALWDEERAAGFYDMAGNVAEWVADDLIAYGSDSSSPPTDPLALGDATQPGRVGVVRGGSWMLANGFHVRAGGRMPWLRAYHHAANVGGRCAASPLGLAPASGSIGG